MVWKQAQASNAYRHPQGIDDKDWTQPTDLDQWLRAKPQKGAEYLAELRNNVENGSFSIEDLEVALPPREITNFYWSSKTKLERHRGKRAILLIGFCPQYNETLPDDPSLVSKSRPSILLVY